MTTLAPPLAVPPVQPRMGRDSTTLADIPIAGTDVVMVYSNGKYKVTGTQVTARFHATPVAWFDVTGDDIHADMLDWETGNAGFPSTAIPLKWVKDKLALHQSYPPIVYTFRNALTPLFNTFHANKLVAGVDFMIGIATLDGTRKVADMTGVTFVQSRGVKQTGGHWDESDIYDPHWKVPPAVAHPGPTRAQVITYIGTNLK